MTTLTNATVLTKGVAMSNQEFWQLERSAGVFLVLSFVTSFTGVMMFWLRDGVSGAPPPSTTYLAWERSFLMAAAVLAVIGFGLLAESLHATGGRLLAHIGMIAYVFAGILLVTAEALSLGGERAYYPLLVCAVVMTFLAQATFGGALRQAGMLAPWIGWATILWNLAWLVVLPIVTPGDIYFPVLHYPLPLVIGIALLWKAIGA